MLLIIAKICQKRFNSDEGNNRLLLSIIATYELTYTPQLVECLTQTFETIDDDRLSRFVPYLLSHSINFLSHGHNVLYFIQILYKNIEWAIGIDPEVVNKATSDELNN